MLNNNNNPNSVIIPALISTMFFLSFKIVKYFLNFFSSLILFSELFSSAASYPHLLQEVLE